MTSAVTTRTVAADVRPIVEAFLGADPPLHVTCWDGSAFGDPAADVRIRITSPRALRRLLWTPNELGLGRAYVTGELELEGSIFDLLGLRDQVGGRRDDVALALGRREWAQLARRARRLGALGPPLPPPAEEAKLRGRLHSRARDRSAIEHHYDVGNDFYRLVLGPTMTYSCAYFPADGTHLDEAQAAKFELVCGKLGLRPGMRLLDVGCGWGGLLVHAAKHHGVRALGVTISEAQAARAREQVEREGLTGQVEVRLCDYRDVDDGPFDAISSVGMFEHVGMRRLQDYIGRLHQLLTPEGRLLNHAISRPSGEPAFDRDSFVSRYVFPDGELQEVGRVVTAFQEAGLECRDVESLREHYARTLRCWVANLERRWDEAVALAGAPRARIWQLYMAGSALGFEAGRISIHQVLVVRPSASGASGMPPTRHDFLVAHPRLERPIRSPA